jgi:hypothetical protein
MFNAEVPFNSCQGACDCYRVSFPMHTCADLTYLLPHACNNAGVNPLLVAGALRQVNVARNYQKLKRREVD